MPLVIGDPSLNAGIVNQNSSLFDFPDTPAPSILNFQAVPSQPLPDRTATATGLLAPDLLLQHWLANFPGELYSLTPSSALMHFMAALMGDSGAGQLRKLQTVARLQSAITSSNFYDLDSFWGALFGALRGPAGSLPANPATGTAFNPYTDLASSDAWDDIYSADAVFRSRIVALARAITLGATVPGLQAIAEAISGVRCSVYEVWRLIDGEGGQGAPGNTWSQLQAQYATWNAIGTQTWDQLQGVTVFGGLGINARNEIIIQPRRSYGSDPAGRRQQAADTWGILKVVEVLRPASALVSVNVLGAEINVPVTPRALWADSDFWEVVPHVIPASSSDPAYRIAFSSFQRNGRPLLLDMAIPQPSPPFSQRQGTQYSYVGDVTAVTGTATLGRNFGDPGNLHNYETLTGPGQARQWLPALAVMDQARAASARFASAAGIQAAPYVGPRQTVPTAG